MSELQDLTSLIRANTALIVIETPDEAADYLDLGVRHFNLASDVSILYRWWAQNGEMLRKILK